MNKAERELLANVCMTLAIVCLGASVVCMTVGYYYHFCKDWYNAAQWLYVSCLLYWVPAQGFKWVAKALTDKDNC